MCDFNTYYLTFFKNKSLRTETGKAFEQRRGLNFLIFFCPCKLEYKESTHSLHVKEIMERISGSLTLLQQYLKNPLHMLGVLCGKEMLGQ